MYTAMNVFSQFGNNISTSSSFRHVWLRYCYLDIPSDDQSRVEANELDYIR